MKKTILILFLGILAMGCSSDSDQEAAGETTIPADFKLVIDGVEISYPMTPYEVSTNGYSVWKKGDIITVNASDGALSSADAAFSMSLNFTTTGKFISGYMKFNSYDAGSPEFKNYINFPSNYFEVLSLSLDEVNKKIKLKFAGKLYINNELLTSEAKDIMGDLDMAYLDDGDVSDPLIVRNVEQYCKASLNGVPWSAKFERSLSSFTDEGAYRIETHFANSPNPGSFTFNSSDTNNYVRFSKFNPSTQVYDYYNVNGTVAYSYREYHGYSNYSFIGTFAFTAVNPNNPSDVVQVTDGVFRSYQEF